jgi:hypothetical protein
LAVAICLKKRAQQISRFWLVGLNLTLGFEDCSISKTVKNNNSFTKRYFSKCKLLSAALDIWASASSSLFLVFAPFIQKSGVRVEFEYVCDFGQNKIFKKRK